MSVSYISDVLKSSKVTKLNDDTFVEFNNGDSVEFTQELKDNDHKSVDFSYFYDNDSNKRFYVTFRNYLSQKEVDTILKSFTIMLNVKFYDEEEFFS